MEQENERLKERERLVGKVSRNPSRDPRARALDAGATKGGRR